jgi:WD40 repeat protein
VSHTNWPWGVAFSPNGKTLASCGGHTIDGDNAIYIWDVATGKELQQLNTNRPVAAVTFSPDGKLLASAGSGDAVHLWDATNWKELRSIGGPHSAVYTLAFSPDGKFLASGDQLDKTVILWEVASGKEVRRFGEQNGRINKVLFSPDGKNLLAAGEESAIEPGKAQGAPIHCWEIATGKEVKRFEGYKGFVTGFAFSSDGKTLVSIGYESITPSVFEGTLRVWDVATAKEMRLLAKNTEMACPWDVALSPDGKTVASSGTDHAVRLWDVGTGKEICAAPGHGQRVTSVGLSTDGKTAVSVSGDGTIRKWDAATGEELCRFNSGCFDVSLAPVLRTTLSHDAGVAALWKFPMKPGVRLWDVTAAKELYSLNRENMCTPSLSRDGRMLATAGQPAFRTCVVRLWDVRASKELRELNGFFGVSCLAFSPDDTVLAVSGANIRENSFIKLYDVASGRELKRISVIPGYAAALALSPNGRTLAAWHVERLRNLGKCKCTLILWEVATGMERARLMDLECPESRRYLPPLVFSPDGRTLTTPDSENTVRLWDVATGQELHGLEGHRGQVTSLSFSGDGQRLLSGSEDTSVLVWDLSQLPKNKLGATVRLSPKDLDLEA